MEEIFILRGLDNNLKVNNIEASFLKLDNVSNAHFDEETSHLTLSYEGKLININKLNKVIKKTLGKDVSIEYLSSKESKKEKVIGKGEIFLISRIIISLTILLLSMFWLTPTYENTDLYFIPIITYVVGWFIISYDVLWEIVENIIHKENFFDEALLMSIASIGAFAIQEYFEGCLVMILSQVGELFEHISLHRSKNAIVDATDLRPKTATVLKNNKLVTMRAEDVKVGDIILIKVGETIACDGEVEEGEGRANTSSLTGESYPILLKKGSKALSGYILESGELRVKVSKAYEDSTIAKVIELVSSSQENKSKTESFITKFAKWYTPCVAFLAAFVLIVGGAASGEWLKWTYNALNFLVISCPCAIVISIPLSYFTGIGLASKNGIIVKGGNYLDALNSMQKLYFDKTGTITQGKFSLVRFEAVEMEEKEFLEMIYRIEKRSNHPIGKAIVDSLDLKIDADFRGKSEDIPGYGLKANYKKKEVLIGSRKLMEKEGVNVPLIETYSTLIYVAIDKEYKGYLILDDKIKNDAYDFVSNLKNNYVKGVMLTGDLKGSAERAAKELGIDEYHAELLPSDKLNVLENDLKDDPKRVIGFMGDGVNDAPCIARANVGIAMGGLGSDVTVENADVVIMDDSPDRVNDAIKVARATRLRAIVDISVALLVKVIIMILSLLSLVPMWVAVLADSGLAVVLIIYSVLLIKKKIHKKKEITL